MPPPSDPAARYAALVQHRFLLETELQRTSALLNPLLRRSAALCAEASATRAMAQRIRNRCRPRP